MKKINKNQRILMKVAGTILFVIALVLTLDLCFNKSNKIDKKYVGKWMIGYKFYEGETQEKLLYTFEQELYLKKDGTFYTSERYIPSGSKENKVSGKYSTSDDKVVLTYEQLGESKSNILILKGNKLCLTTSCSKYYTLDKIETYFPMNNASVRTVEAK